MLRRPLAIVGSVVALAAIGAGVTAVKASDGGRGGCPPSSAVFARTGTVAVVRRRTGGIVACLRRAPVSEELSDEYFESVFRFPALAIKGTRVAYAVSDFEDPNDTLNSTDVLVLDLPSPDPFARYVAVPTFPGGTRVTRIVLRSDGAVAWTACESSSYPPPVRVTRGGECSRPGRRTWVFAVTSDGRRRRLASGKTIDPQFLRLQGHGRLAWRANGRTRSARVR